MARRQVRLGCLADHLSWARCTRVMVASLSPPVQMRAQMESHRSLHCHSQCSVAGAVNAHRVGQYVSSMQDFINVKVQALISLSG